MKHSTFKSLVNLIFYIGMGIAIVIIVASYLSGCKTLSAIVSSEPINTALINDATDIGKIATGISTGNIGLALLGFMGVAGGVYEFLGKYKEKKKTKTLISGVEDFTHNNKQGKELKSIIEAISKKHNIDKALHSDVQKLTKNSKIEKKKCVCK